MILLHLYLAHLIADFPLQPMPLVEWKHKSLWGVFAHALIHLATMVVITIPFIGTPGLYEVLLGIFVIHFFVDAIKVEAEKHTSKQLELFLLDQFIHLITIVWLGFFLLEAHVMLFATNLFLPQLSFVVWTVPFVPVYLILLLLVTYFYEIALFFAKNLKKPKFDFKGMAIRALLLTIAFWGSFIYLIALINS